MSGAQMWEDYTTSAGDQGQRMRFPNSWSARVVALSDGTILWAVVNERGTRMSGTCESWQTAERMALLMTLTYLFARQTRPEIRSAQQMASWRATVGHQADAALRYAIQLLAEDAG